MKKVSFLIFGFISLGLYFFAYDFNSSFNTHEVTQAQFFSATRPNWKIQTLNAKDSYELNSLKAFQEENKKVYLLDEPIFKAYWENQSRSTASSISAIFDVSNDMLIMTNNVHLSISTMDEKIDLFTKKINFDFKKRSATSKNEVELKNSFIKL